MLSGIWSTVNDYLEAETDVDGIAPRILRDNVPTDATWFTFKYRSTHDPAAVPYLKPRRMAFLVDRSGSMGGTCLEQARNAVRACLGALAPDDEFNIVAFDSAIEVFRKALVPGTQENRDAAERFLNGVDARGGTELLTGVEAATQHLKAGGGGDIFILTDGQVFGGEEILQGVRDSGIRIHCLGIGSASEDRLLRHTIASRRRWRGPT